MSIVSSCRMYLLSLSYPSYSLPRSSKHAPLSPSEWVRRIVLPSLTQSLTEYLPITTTIIPAINSKLSFLSSLLPYFIITIALHTQWWVVSRQAQRCLLVWVSLRMLSDFSHPSLSSYLNKVSKWVCFRLSLPLSHYPYLYVYFMSLCCLFTSIYLYLYLYLNSMSLLCLHIHYFFSIYLTLFFLLFYSCFLILFPTTYFDFSIIKNKTIILKSIKKN